MNFFQIDKTTSWSGKFLAFELMLMQKHANSWNWLLRAFLLLKLFSNFVAFLKSDQDWPYDLKM